MTHFIAQNTDNCVVLACDCHAPVCKTSIDEMTDLYYE